MTIKKVSIESKHAPKAIGPYSPAIKCGETVYLSGQIPLDPQSMTVVSGGIAAETNQVLANLAAICQEAGGSLDEIVKLTIYLIDLTHFPLVNDIMMRVFNKPYPARTTIQVSALPKAVQIEIDAIMHLP